MRDDAARPGLQVVMLRTLREYMVGRTTAGESCNVHIKNVLGRQSRELDSSLAAGFIEGKRVLVTRAGGSIG